MIVVAIMAVGPQHQQPQAEVIAGKEAVGADDVGPAIVGAEPFAQHSIGIGLRLPPIERVFNRRDGGREIRVQQHDFADAFRKVAKAGSVCGSGSRKAV